MPAPHLRFEYVPAPVDRTYIGRRVLCGSSPVGRVCAVVHVHEDGEHAFTIINFGSVSRVGEDRRAVPLAMLTEDEKTGDLVLKLDAEKVRRSPIYVEGPRCDCVQWLERVSGYYAQA